MTDILDNYYIYYLLTTSICLFYHHLSDYFLLVPCLEK